MICKNFLSLIQEKIKGSTVVGKKAFEIFSKHCRVKKLNQKQFFGTRITYLDIIF